ncbi:MAG: hypothetical protein AB1626_00970 [Candidatus Micrarchaeota archaeon]
MVTQQQYEKHRRQVATTLVFSKKGNAVLDYIDGLPVSIDEKDAMLDSVENIAAAVNSTQVRDIVVDYVHALSSKTRTKKLFTPQAFAQVLETAARRMTGVRKEHQAHAVLRAFNDLAEHRVLGTRPYVDVAVKLAADPTVNGAQFQAITSVLEECFKGVAVTPQHFKEFFAKLEKTYEAAERHGLPHNDYARGSGYGNVFKFMKAAFEAAPSRLNHHQARDLIALTTHAIEGKAPLSSVSQLLANSALAFGTQSPAQITKTIELLDRTVARQGGAAAGETADQMTSHPASHDVRLRVVEKALQNQVKPHRALEVHGSAWKENAARAADVEEGIEGGVLLGPEGCRQLNQEPISRKGFLARARKTVAELATRKPRDSFERELRELHY